jgi:hypothetical protein
MDELEAGGPMTIGIRPSIDRSTGGAGGLTRRATGQHTEGKILYVLLALFLAGCVSACAAAPPPQSALPPPSVAPPPPPLSPQEALRARAEQFWNARVRDDPAMQWELLPSEDKQRVTLTAYVRSHSGLRYVDYTIQEVTVDGGEGTVRLVTRFRLNVTNLPPMVAAELTAKGPWPSRVNERWVMRDGTWYRPLVQSTPGPSAPRSPDHEAPGS